MAAIENLEIIVNVDIGSAIASLEDLQDELRDVADTINRVDARGSEGIDIDVDVHGTEAELAAMRGKIEAAEQTTSIDIPMNVHDRGFEEILARAGADSVGDLVGRTDRVKDMMSRMTTPDGNIMEFMNSRVRIEQPGGGRSSTAGIRSMLRRTLGDAVDSIQNFDLRMSDLHNMLARIVPLLVIFLGTIPAVVTALVGLAAAAVAAAAGLMALAGLGALGVGLQGGQFDADRLADVWEDIRDSFIEAFGPLAERLQPLFLDAVDGLGRMFQAIANSGDALVELTDEARAFGGFLLDFVPGALRTLGALVEALAPIFGDIGSFLEREFANIVRTLVSLTHETIPAIAEMAMRIGRAIPAIIRMSIGFVQVANVVIRLLGLFARFLGLLGISPRIFGLVVAGTLAAVTAFLLWNSAILAVASGALMRLGAVILATIGKMTGYSMATIAATLASWGLYRALVALIGLTGVGLVLVGLSAGASAMADKFGSAASSISDTTKALKEFDRVSGRAGTDGFNPYGAGTDGAGAADVSAGTSAARNGGKTVINIESSGDADEDASNARYAGWRQGRTTGGSN